MKRQPRLLITLGDVAGIGPEVVAKAWPELLAICRPIVIGDVGWMRRATKLDVVPIKYLDAAQPSQKQIPCLQATKQDLHAVAVGTITAAAGQAAYDFLCAAIDLTLAKHADGIVTLPLHKEGLHAAGLHYPGHTEILAERTGVKQFGMMLYAPPGNILLPSPPVLRGRGAGGEGVEAPTLTTSRAPSTASRAERATPSPPAPLPLSTGGEGRGTQGIGVVHVTLHMALRDIFRHITTRAILEKIQLLHDVMKKLVGKRPRLAVAALNPHASDGGLFGDEETKVIMPAVERARQARIDVKGPLPSDTLFVQAARGNFDGVVAMYHDQGHIALKLLTGLAAVNVTLGLPIVRTSVAHGTAYDIAGKGIADHHSLLEAARVAALLVKDSTN